MKQTFKVGLLAAATGLMLTAGAANAAKTIKIALAGPVSGAVAQYGDMQATGAKMAIERYNVKGGVSGKRRCCS